MLNRATLLTIAISSLIYLGLISMMKNHGTGMDFIKINHLQNICFFVTMLFFTKRCKKGWLKICVVVLCWFAIVALIYPFMPIGLIAGMQIVSMVIRSVIYVILAVVITLCFFKYDAI